MSDLYRQDILDELKNPQGVGRLDDPTLSHQAHNSSCGDDLTVYINLSEDKKTINEIKWHGTGCAISQVSMSQLVAHLEGISVKEAINLESTTILKWLGLTCINPGREKCLTLGLRAVKQALSELNDL